MCVRVFCDLQWRSGIKDVLVWQIPYQADSAVMWGYMAARSVMMVDLKIVVARNNGGRRLASLGKVNRAALTSSRFIVLCA